MDGDERLIEVILVIIGFIIGFFLAMVKINPLIPKEIEMLKWGLDILFGAVGAAILIAVYEGIKAMLEMLWSPSTYH